MILKKKLQAPCLNGLKKKTAKVQGMRGERGGGIQASQAADLAKVFEAFWIWTKGENVCVVRPPPRLPAFPGRIKFKGFLGPGVARF